MKKRKLLITSFILLCLVQTAVPLSMIARREFTLRNGRVYKFKTAPVDPYDAFRGRFVALAVEQRSLDTDDADKFLRHQKIYVRLKEDEQGYAVVDSVSAVRPDRGDYIKARVSHRSGNKLHILWPFDRYYMNEADAPQAERVYRSHTRQGKHDAHIAVRVTSGFAVIEELYIANQPILEFMAEAKE